MFVKLSVKTYKPEEQFTLPVKLPAGHKWKPAASK
jgi:hypothetical protein